MKKLILALSTLLSLNAFADSVPVFKAEGWQFIELRKGGTLSEFTGGPDALLGHPNEGRGGTVVKIKALHDIGQDLGKSPEAWRKALLGQYERGFTCIRETVFEVNGSLRYFGECDSDTRTSSMLRSAILGVVVNGRLYRFSFEDHPPMYQRDIKAVRDLYRDLAIGN